MLKRCRFLPMTRAESTQHACRLEQPPAVFQAAILIFRTFQCGRKQDEKFAQHSPPFQEQCSSPQTMRRSNLLFLHISQAMKTCARHSATVLTCTSQPPLCFTTCLRKKLRRK